MIRHGSLIIICGLPGSGKTTLAQKLETNLNAVRFCPDEWMDDLALNLWDEDRRNRIETMQWKLGRKLLSTGVTVIIEWGTWGKSERDALRIGAKELGASVELHYLSVPADILFSRIQTRGKENPPIQRSDIDGWFKVFQAPTAEEMDLFDKAHKHETLESGL